MDTAKYFLSTDYTDATDCFKLGRIFYPQIAQMTQIIFRGFRVFRG